MAGGGGAGGAGGVGGVGAAGSTGAVSSSGATTGAAQVVAAQISREGGSGAGGIVGM